MCIDDSKRLQVQNTELRQKYDSLENQSHRHNFLFYEITYGKQKTWEESEKKVWDGRANLDIDNTDTNLGLLLDVPIMYVGVKQPGKIRSIVVHFT